MEEIAAYICVGDSMSIDLYPYLELSRSNQAVAKEVGAGSLLYRNHDDLWPEFSGNDLVRCYPELAYINLAEDGATTFNFMDASYLQLAETYRDSPVFITVTLGGNDFLRIINRSEYASAKVHQEIANLTRRYKLVLELLMNVFPRGICLLSTIYDPTDGTGKLPGFPDVSEGLKWLNRVNNFIRAYGRRSDALVADAHRHFFGHGLSAPVEDRWYWEPNPIEPSARGASELRRLWLRALADEGLI